MAIPERIDWADLTPARWDSPNLILTVGVGLRMSAPPVYTVRVERERTSDAGRKLKPEHVITLTGPIEEGLHTLFRCLADTMKQGVVEVNA